MTLIPVESSLLERNSLGTKSATRAAAIAPAGLGRSGSLWCPLRGIVFDKSLKRYIDYSEIIV